MKAVLLVFTTALVPTNAFLSATRAMQRQNIFLQNVADNTEKNNKFEDLPRTLNPSDLQLTLDPSEPQITLDPSEFQKTLNPSEMPEFQRTLGTVDPFIIRDTPIPRAIDQSAADQQPALIETIGGGTSMIFEMARRMLVWDETETRAANKKVQKNKASSSKTNTKAGSIVLPRWHPHSGISDVNPSFRTESPIMNNQGYASTIWRNVRKRNKPSLWRHALRTYDRMEAAANDSKTSVLRIERTTIHHEGAMLACAKLGLWKEALEIFRSVEKESVGLVSNRRKGEGVTDSMVFSLVKACVRSCKKMGGGETPLEERRAPLDAAVQVVKTVHSHHFPVVARHLNPLAAAYQSLGLLEDAKMLLQQNLGDRSIGPEPENGRESFNVHDVSAKDKASYALLVKGAIASGSWADAVEELRSMTDVGLYPSNSHLNKWTEVSERKTRRRTTRSWKKKRDEYWLESVR